MLSLYDCPECFKAFSFVSWKNISSFKAGEEQLLQLMTLRSLLKQHFRALLSVWGFQSWKDKKKWKGSCFEIKMCNYQHKLGLKSRENWKRYKKYAKAFSTALILACNRRHIIVLDPDLEMWSIPCMCKHIITLKVIGVILFWAVMG